MSAEVPIRDHARGGEVACLSPKHDAMHLVPLWDAVDFADDQASGHDESHAACQQRSNVPAHAHVGVHQQRGAPATLGGQRLIDPASQRRPAREPCSYPPLPTTCRRRAPRVLTR